MMHVRLKGLTPLICVSALALSTASAMADQTSGSSATAPTRVLVYRYSYSSNGDLQEHGVNGYASDTKYGSQNSHDYTSAIDDKGTITVDVVKEQHDGGLVVMVSEQAEHLRNAPPAECVVYGDAINILCDPNKTIYSEEMTLLRYLGPTFLDPNHVDAQQHWQTKDGNQKGTTVADFYIKKITNGMVALTESRTIKDLDVPPVTTNVDATIDYDMSRSIPVSVNETATRRQSAGGSNMTTEIQTTLQLQTDSLH